MQLAGHIKILGGPYVARGPDVAIGKSAKSITSNLYGPSIVWNKEQTSIGKEKWKMFTEKDYLFLAYLVEHSDKEN